MASPEADHGRLTNLLETLENWTRALDEGYGLDVVYLDYRKAFDSVPHRRLLEKLKGLGIKGKLLQWLENFLISRTMRVNWYTLTSRTYKLF